MLVLVSLFALALAQETDVVGESVEVREAWVVESTRSQRFHEPGPRGPELSENARVTVLYQVDDLVRIRRTNSYGWVPTAALTYERPEGVAPTPSEGVPTPTAPEGEFDLEALQQLLERTEL